MSYEVYHLKFWWGSTRSKTELYWRIWHSRNELDEGISIPVEVDGIDFLPELIDPTMDVQDIAAGVAMIGDIQRSLRKYRVWLDKTGRIAVTRPDEFFPDESQVA